MSANSDGILSQPPSNAKENNEVKRLVVSSETEQMLAHATEEMLIGFSKELHFVISQGEQVRVTMIPPVIVTRKKRTNLADGKLKTKVVTRRKRRSKLAMLQAAGAAPSTPSSTEQQLIAAPITKEGEKDVEVVEEEIKMDDKDPESV